MAGFVGNNGNPAWARHRLTGSFVDAITKRSEGFGSLKHANKHTNDLWPERSSICKLHFLKIVIVMILASTFLTLLRPPAVCHNEDFISTRLSSKFLSVGRTWHENAVDSQYTSYLDVEWDQVLKALKRIDDKEGTLKVGLMNFNFSEMRHWQKLFPHARLSAIHLDHIDNNITWNVLYPEWIDEENSEVPLCPRFPVPEVPGGVEFDLIVTKLPCNTSGHWSRNVERLHLQLAAAKVAAESAGSRNPVHVLFVSNCYPIPNLFTCKDLVTREGDAWLYKPDSRLLKEKLQLPVGSCEVALPFKARETAHSVTPHREAYATILHSANVYVCGAIAAAQSIRLTGSERELVILVDESVGEHHRSGLEAAGWKIKTVERIRNPKAKRNAYNEWNYSKFRLWQLTEYDKVIFIDADLLILRNIDFLFSMPEITATGNDATLFNSGVMVIEPSNCTFRMLMEHIDEIESYNGGDQGYLNEVFTWWHRMPKQMNFLKHFWEGDDEDAKQLKSHLFGADPPVLYVLHYLGLKPWLCFRDYDCNWNVKAMQKYASDAAHATWWRVHDKMAEHLQSFCLLESIQKAGLEWGRRQAEKANYTDGHWRRNVSDPRLSICSEKLCNWENMLLHWGDPNWSGDKNKTSSADQL